MRRFSPTMTSLQAFDAAVRYLSFTRAAEDLGITPSGISRQIRNLEEFLGLTLFERAGPRIVLTEAGRRYYEEISQLLDRIEEVSIDAVRGRSTEGILRIAMPPTIGLRWGNHFLRLFHEAHPDILFETSTCANGATPHELNVDVAILRGSGNWAQCRTEALAAEELVVVGAPQNLPATGYLVEDRLSEQVLLQNASRPSLWLHWLRAAQVDYRGVIVGPRFDLTESIVQAATAGMGLAVLPEIHIRRELASGALRPAFAQRCLSGETYYLCVSEDRQSRRSVQILRRWLLAEMRRQQFGRSRPPAQK